MKVENLKKHPYVAAFISSAMAEQAAELKETLLPLTKEEPSFIEMLVFRKEDKAKFKHPEDMATVLPMLMLLAHGMAFQLENGKDYDEVMQEFGGILKMLKRNLYKEEYLP